MHTPESISINSFDYRLPDSRIARYPTRNRSGAKQLHFRNGQISESPFSNLPAHLPPGTLLIGNRTRVLHARLHFPLPDPAKRPIEIFCLDPLTPADYARSLGSRESVVWKCLIGGNRRWKRGPLTLGLDVEGQLVHLTAERGEREENTFAITFSWDAPTLSFGELLAAAGTIPLPPYLERVAEESDRERYQTVFAKEEGSVAAPTAGLHFTPEILAELRERGIDWAEVTLHVGAGTFKPVTADRLGDHVMHREFFTVGRPFLSCLHDQLTSGKPIVSVGTTSLRCLESLFYLGVDALRGKLPPPGSPLFVEQWSASRHVGAGAQVRGEEAIEGLLSYLTTHDLARVSGYTQLVLTPGVKIQLIDGLITNFHQPKSTLLLLVAALIGEDWRRVYDYALGNGFRFLSYGDSSLLWKG